MASKAASTASCIFPTSPGTSPARWSSRRHSKGEEIESVILAIDPERERISLGIKQLDQDAFSDYIAVNERNSIVKGVVTDVDQREAEVELAEDVRGILKVSEISVDRVADARSELSVGDEVEAKIISIDRKNRSLGLSIKARALDDERRAHRRLPTRRSRWHLPPRPDHVGRAHQGTDGEGGPRGIGGPAFATTRGRLCGNGRCVQGCHWL